MTNGTMYAAVAELVSFAELCAASGNDAVNAVGVMALRRARRLAEYPIEVSRYSDEDLDAFVRWFDDDQIQETLAELLKV